MEMPAFLAPIANAPRPQKIIFGVIGLVAILAGAWFLPTVGLSAQSAQVETLRTQHAALQKELMDARRIAADIARFRREIVALEQTLTLLTNRLPNERETPPLYRAVSDAAFESGLAVTLFQPREAQVRDYYAEIPVAFTAEGNYHQFGSFFERVARLPRVVNVGDLKITGVTHAKDAKAPVVSAAGPIRGELVLATYQYRPVGSPPAPKAPGAK
jgi:type IV pilus assembly protein PilO